jgi:murein DD-endopeptidase MepM/ murein hydrolase activator NlpD
MPGSLKAVRPASTDRVRPAPRLWMSVDSFEYSPLDGRTSLVRLVAALDPAVGAPARAQLLTAVEVEREVAQDRLRSLTLGAGALEPFATHEAHTARRRGLLMPHHGFEYAVERSDSGLVWQVSFQVPLAVVECRGTYYELAAANLAGVVLPSPERGLNTAVARTGVRTGRSIVRGGRRRLSAFAVGLAIATGPCSLPTPATADTKPLASPATASMAPSPTTVISVLTAGTPAHHRHTRRSTRPPTKPTSGAKSPSMTSTRPTAPRAHTLTNSSHPEKTKQSEHKAATGATPQSNSGSTRGKNSGASPKHPGSTKSQGGCVTSPATPLRTKSSKKHHSGPPARQHRRTPIKHRAHGSRPTAGETLASSHALALARVSPRPAPTIARPHQIYDPDGVARPVTSSPAPVSVGSVNRNPFTAAQLAQFSSLIANADQPPRFLVAIYKAAAKRYHIPWQVLAAINSIETDYGRDLSTSPVGAVGWMQFMPGTWMEYGVAADGSHRRPNPYDPRDAIFSAARYLAASGGSRDIRKAIFAYNHAHWYVDVVLWRAHMITDLGLGKGAPKSGYALPLDARYMHQLGRTDDGLDIEDAPDGAAVYSITPGVVTAVASDPAGFGPNYPVILATAGPLAGQYIYYGHVAASLAHVGQDVAAGQPIAVMGHTGDAAPLGHGHIEIGFSDASGDPLNHHGAVAWTPSGEAMRHVIIGLASDFRIGL